MFFSLLLRLPLSKKWHTAYKEERYKNDMKIVKKWWEEKMLAHGMNLSVECHIKTKTNNPISSIVSYCMHDSSA